MAGERNTAAALEILQHHGPVRVDPTRTIDPAGRTIPWFIVAIDLVCGRETVMVTGEAGSEVSALASAFEQALTRLAV